MIPFEYLEHTADIKFRAYGKSPEEMLANGAFALFKAMVDPATIKAKETWKVELEAPNLEQLAYDWLCEMVFLFETESDDVGNTNRENRSTGKSGSLRK